MRLNALSVERVTGEVLRFGVAPNYEGDDPMLHVALDNGMTVWVGARKSITKDCTVGDRVKLLKQGNRHKLDIAPCDKVEGTAS